MTLEDYFLLTNQLLDRNKFETTKLAKFLGILPQNVPRLFKSGLNIRATKFYGLYTHLTAKNKNMIPYSLLDYVHRDVRTLTDSLTESGHTYYNVHIAKSTYYNIKALKTVPSIKDMILLYYFSEISARRLTLLEYIFQYCTYLSRTDPHN